MESLVGYGSDDEYESERYGSHQRAVPSQRRRDDDTNYDDVNMDMSEGSGEESEPELPQAEPSPPRNSNRRDDRNESDERSREFDRRRQSPPRARNDRDRAERPRRDERLERERGGRGMDVGRRGLLGDRPDSNDKMPSLMDRSQDARDAISPRFADRRDRDRNNRDGDRNTRDGDRNIRDGDRNIRDVDRNIRDGDRSVRDGDRNIRDGDRNVRDGDRNIRDNDRNIRDIDRNIRDNNRNSRDKDRNSRDKDRNSRDMDRNIRDMDRNSRDKERERDRSKHGRRSEEQRSDRPRSRSKTRLQASGSSHSSSSSDRRASPQASEGYRPTSYKVNKKLEVMEKMGLQIKTPSGSMATAQQLRAAASDPSASSAPGPYFNPGINATKILDQVHKRKLLWGNKNKSEAEEAAKWTGTKFSHDQDGKQVSKFMRLMGIKQPDAVKTQADEESDPNKKQEELFEAMQAQYEVARATTHTMRGVGLGFQRGQF